MTPLEFLLVLVSIVAWQRCQEQERNLTFCQNRPVSLAPIKVSRLAALEPQPLEARGRGLPTDHTCGL
jgi:hypothetical protein